MSRRLDRGGGKDLSLKECPREQLEKEASFPRDCVSFVSLSDSTLAEDHVPLP
ncbi:hypothetical protein C8Q77DRAFT_1082423 [Trametes polyzona]|nr:hypothetical protein C8Q77DRAFT_1082423 [Trametes polyzona]